MILGVETSGAVASVALLDENFTQNGLKTPILLGEHSIFSDRTHSQTLMPMIENLLAETGKALQDLTKIAVTVGCGSYTGIRIGISAVKGLCYGLGIPCAGVPTLKSLAKNVSLFDGITISVMKARKDLVYSAVFDRQLQEILPQNVYSQSKIVGFIEQNVKDGKIILVGDGAYELYNLYKELLDFEGKDTEILQNLYLAPPDLMLQKALSTCICGLETEISPDELTPLYLQEFHFG